MALATLLNLDYSDTKIGKGRVPKDVKNPDPELDDLMKDFWVAFDEQFKGAIPPGIIFLRGKKLHVPGFGWAPRTWMEAYEIDYPDPLQSTSFKTVLDKDNGLRVRYPGFILHTPNRNRVLGTDNIHDEFIFPVDRNLIEWYKAKRTDTVQSDYVASIGDNKTTLAIILSRPQPRDLLPEIALLVEIWKQRNETQDKGSKQVFYCQIIHRLQVSRERPAYPDNENDFPHPIVTGPGSEQRDDGDLIIGEVLGPDQEWFVDGYFPYRHKAPPRDKSNPSPANPLFSMKLFGGSARAPKGTQRSVRPPSRANSLVPRATFRTNGP